MGSPVAEEEEEGLGQSMQHFVVVDAIRISSPHPPPHPPPPSMPHAAPVFVICQLIHGLRIRLKYQKQGCFFPPFP